MTSPPKTILNRVTQLIQQTKVNFTQLALKPNARVPKLLVLDADASKPDVYTLLGEKYVLGRERNDEEQGLLLGFLSQENIGLLVILGDMVFLYKKSNELGQVVAVGPPVQRISDRQHLS